MGDVRNWSEIASSRRQGVMDAIARASARTGVDFDYLVDQARVESAFNPGAKARTSSATGLYQFIDQSWLGTIDKHGAKHGLEWAANAIERGRDGRYRVADPAMRQAILNLRYDADTSATMAAEFAGDNADHLEKRLGREPNATELYFAHFMGAGGASRFLGAMQANPDASAAALFPRQAAANRSIFFDRAGGARSLSDVYALMGRKMGAGADNPAMAPVQLATRDPVDSPILSTTPPGQGESLTTGAAENLAQRLAAADRERINPLRPTPQSARLAYLMVVSQLGIG